MDSKIREILESPIDQGENEIIAYKLDTTPWGGSPLNPVVVIYSQSGEDVSDEKLTGAPSVSENLITTPLVHDLDLGSRYRLEIIFEVDGNTLNAFAILTCK